MQFLKDLWYKVSRQGDRVKPPSFRKPSNSANVCYLDTSFNTIKSNGDLLKLHERIKGSSLNGKVLNLNGAILDGKKLKGDGGQGENQDPLLRIHLEGVTIRNGFCRNVKDGIRAAAPNITFANLTFVDVGEDAISNDKNAPGTRVIDCEFDNSKRKSADKSIQLNNGDDALVERCVIYRGITGIRMGDKWNTSKHRGTITDTTFVGVDTAINLAKIQVKLSGNKFEGVRQQVKHSLGSKVV